MKALAITLRIIGWTLFVLSAGFITNQDYSAAFALFMLFAGCSTIATRLQTRAAKDTQ